MEPTILTSDKQSVSVPCEKAFSFLSDFNNYEKLMPGGKVSNWESDEKTCSFIIKGMSAIGMEIRETHAPDNIQIRSTSKSPIRFDLIVKLAGQGQSCELAFEFRAELNAFMKMMVEKPLTAFFNILAENAKTALEAG